MRSVLCCTLVLIGVGGTVRGQEPATDAFDRGMEFYWANEMDSAVVYLLDAARTNPTVGNSWAWLAEAQRRAGEPAAAVASARAALVLDPCSAFAHTVLGAALNPVYGAWDGADANLAWSHTLLATRCDPSDGNAWLNLVFPAMERGRSGLMDSALVRLIDTGFLQPTALSYSRWVLEALPPHAVLITNGDLDTYPPLAIQAGEAVRTDVVVVNASLLNTGWYGDTIATRYGLPPVASLHGDEPAGPWATPMIASWVNASLDGTLERPIALATTVGSTLRDALPGSLQFAGTHWLVVARGATRVDTAAVRKALAEIDPASWRGAATSERDRSPVRRRSDGGIALVPLLAALYEGCTLARAGDARGATETATWMRGYVRDAQIKGDWAGTALQVGDDGFPATSQWCER